MERFVLTDAQWANMEPHCQGKPTDLGRSGRNDNLIVEAVLCIVRTGSPWRDVLALFGNWRAAFHGFSDVMSWTTSAPAELCNDVVVVGPRLGVVP